MHIKARLSRPLHDAPRGMISLSNTSLINVLNTVAVSLHAVSFLATLIFSVATQTDSTYRLTYASAFWPQTEEEEVVWSDSLHPYPTHEFGNGTIYMTFKQSNLYVSVTGLVSSFFFLSALFQALWTGPMRFIEYSLSASLMVVLLALQTGVWDGLLLFALWGLTMGCMLVGYVADLLHKEQSERPYQPLEEDSRYMIPPKYWLHLIGWIQILFAYVIIWVQFGIALHDNPDTPGFVIAIVVVESLLFLSFGFVQLAEFAGYITENTAKIIYISLSLTSKTILGWVVFSEVVIASV